MEEILLKNCTFLTMDESNPRFFGWIWMKNGKIVSMGTDEPPACGQVVDGRGGVVTPGLIDIHSHLGLYEDGLRARTGTRIPTPLHRTCARSMG